MGKSVPSPTGKPSKKKAAVKRFEKGDAGGGKRKSEYSRKDSERKRPTERPQRKYGNDAPARRRERNEPGLA